eukprot:m.61598 g.61598  ORF g.61598 m.61598 type:complete len:373 (+) comp11428_c0_seq1:256-1374(+)
MSSIDNSNGFNNNMMGPMFNGYPLIPMLLLLVVVCVAIWKRFSAANKVPNEANQISTCSNPYCVRCGAYAESLSEAKTRLAMFMSMREEHAHLANRIRASFAARDMGEMQSNKNFREDPKRSARYRGRVQQEDEDIVQLEINQMRDHNKYDKELETNTEPIASQKPTVFFLCNLRTQAWVTEWHTQAVASLEQPNILDAILAEYQRNNSERAFSWVDNDVQGWDVLHLYNQGIRMNDACAAYPVTSEIVESLPGLLKDCIFGNVFFSRIRTGTQIEPHCGPSNVRHRLHFPILVPGSVCKDPVLIVDSEARKWKAGKCIVFDDSLLHSADYGQDGDQKHEERVVLIVDLWHPNLTDYERECLSYVFCTMDYV